MKLLRILKKICKGILYIALAALGLIAVTVILVNMIFRPSHDRNWTDDQKVLAYSEVYGNMVNIHNIRNVTYESTTDYKVDHYDRTYDLNKLKQVWFMVEPFTTIPGGAHTLMSFEFEDDVFVSISVEIRKEKGESFHPVTGLFNQFELMYVIADERDVIKLRSNYRHDQVYLYPIKTTPELAKELFLGMLKRANDIKAKPEFYNTIGSNCTTNIARHVNNLVPGKVPLDLSLLFPADSDKLAYDLGLIDTDLPFEQAREKYHINERAATYAGDPNFSRRIRE